MVLLAHSPSGRWRIQLFNKINAKGTTVDDPSVSPVIRQTLLHWAYELSEADYDAWRREKKR